MTWELKDARPPRTVGLQESREIQTVNINEHDFVTSFDIIEPSAPNWGTDFSFHDPFELLTTASLFTLFHFQVERVLKEELQDFKNVRTPEKKCMIQQLSHQWIVDSKYVVF